MSRIGSVLAREIREALPPFVFFLFLFHMVALTKAVALGDYRITALRATVATVGALIVAKAILLIEALPISGLFPEKRMVQVFWKTLLFAAAALLPFHRRTRTADIEAWRDRCRRQRVD